ncbi:MAG: hypothetical protein QM786_06320 [Breznakibacter sp.]
MPPAFGTRNTRNVAEWKLRPVEIKTSTRRIKNFDGSKINPQRVGVKSPTG